MRRIPTTLSIAAVLLMLVLLVLPVQAVPGIRTSTAGGILQGMIPAGALERFEEQGYDMTAVRAALEIGDQETARTLLAQFMAEHRDELPPPPGEEARLSARLDALEAEGIDVRAPREALANGDINAVLTLLKQLLGRDGEMLPPDAKDTRLLARIDRLEEQGFDMTAIRAALESGDQETARTLLAQFMAEHKDEFPAPPEGERRFSAQTGGNRTPDGDALLAPGAPGRRSIQADQPASPSPRSGFGERSPLSPGR